MTAAKVEQSQVDKFKQAARELETDDDPERFKERLGKLVKHKPVPEAGIVGEPITPGLGAPIVAILEARTGSETTVEMADGKSYSVFNVCWGRDIGEDWEHVSANISPQVEGVFFDFFLTSDVKRLVAPETKTVLWQSADL